MFHVKGTALNTCGVYLRGYADVGTTYSGKNSVIENICHCDCPTDNRYKHKAGRGEVWDASVAIGYQLCACDDKLVFAPVVGYSIHEQRVKRFGPLHTFFEENFLGLQPPKDSDCCEVLCPDNVCKLDLQKCLFKSTHRSRWTSPFVGMDATYEWTCNTTIYGSMEYHWANYNGRGRWAFTQTFVDDYRQTANGCGYVFGLGGVWNCNDCWSFGVDAKWNKWDTRRGKDRSCLACGDCFNTCNALTPVTKAFGDLNTECIGEQETICSRLIDNEWQSVQVVFTANWTF